MQRQPEFRIHLTAVDNRRQLAVDLHGEHILILEPVLVVAEEFGVHPRGNHVVVVTLDMEQRLDVLEEVWDLVPVDGSHHNRFAAGEQHVLRLVRLHRRIYRSKDLL